MYGNLKNCNTFHKFPSKPSCTDIMEIYNAVEEMDDDEEVSLEALINFYLLCVINWKLLYITECMNLQEYLKNSF